MMATPDKLRALLLAGTLTLAPGCISPGLPSTSDGGPSDASHALPDAGSGADSGVSDDGGLALASACRALGERRCEYWQRCGLIATGDGAFRSCVKYLRATWCGPTRWPSRAEVGTLQYEPATAQACADGFLARNCGEWSTTPEACGRFLGPNVYLNQECFGGYSECLGGAVCRGTACPKLCLALGGAREPCETNADCQAGVGLYCRIVASSVTTGVGLCTEYGAAGSACDSETLCASELACLDGRCEERRAVGQTCREGACVGSAWCNFAPDGGVCMAAGGEGVPCTDDRQCLHGLFCDVGHSGACRPLGPLDGGACALEQTCAEGLACVGATAFQLGECLPPRAASQACTSSVDCDGDLACNQVAGAGVLTCGPRRANGSVCQVSRDCLIFSRCANGNCAALPEPGSPCLRRGGGGQVDAVCLFGVCEQLVDAGSVCGDMGGPGDACASDGECASNRCLLGTCIAGCAP